MRTIVALLLILLGLPCFAANEIQLLAPEYTGSTVYMLVLDEAGQAWNGSAFATYTTTQGNFDVAMTEVSGTGLFRGSIPGPSGQRTIMCYLQADGTPAQSDLAVQVDSGYFDTVAGWKWAALNAAVDGLPTLVEVRADLERNGGMLQLTHGYASTASSEASLAKANAANAFAAAAAIDVPTPEEVAASVSEETPPSAFFTNAPEPGTTQPRVNKAAAVAYQFDLVDMADGTYKAVGRRSKAIRLRPGAILGEGIAVQVFTTRVFGNTYVKTVHEPMVSGGSITATALGPRDDSGMVRLNGTATAGEERTVSFDVTMETGERITITVDLKAFSD